MGGRADLGGDRGDDREPEPPPGAGMNLPDAPWRHRAGLDRLLKALGADDGETRYVGGCVRDTLLGLEVSDVDLATTIAPDAVIARLEAARIKAVPTGLA